MTITELIAKLEQIRKEHGDIDAVTSDYDSIGYDEPDPTIVVTALNGGTLVLVLNT